MSSRRARKPLVAAVAAAAASAACGAMPPVPRVVDGAVRVGIDVSPEAYAAFLRGTLAERDGRKPDAVAAYEDALDAAHDEPLLLARLAAARCAVDPDDARADRLLARAVKLDPSSGPVAEGIARCASGRKNAEATRKAAEQIVRAEPFSARLERLRVEVSPVAAASARQRLVALTVARGGDATAFEALRAWARAHDDAELEVHALVRLVELGPAAAVADAEAVAGRLEGEGARALATRLAEAVVDARRSRGGPRPRARVTGWLALDAALARGDVELARARASAVGISDVGFAARAILLGRADLARPALEARLGAEPTAEEACALAALLELPACAGPPASARATRADDALVRLVLVDRLHAAGDDLGELTRGLAGAFLPGDDLVEEALARLVGDGALSPEGVTPSVNVRARLAGASLPGVPMPPGLAPRLALASRVLDAPESDETRDLAVRLAHVAGSDPYVVAAWSRLDGPVPGELRPDEALAAHPTHRALLAALSGPAWAARRPELAAVARPRLAALDAARPGRR